MYQLFKTSTKSTENRFCTSSKGKSELVDNNDTEVAHAKNRRAVIEFVD